MCPGFTCCSIKYRLVKSEFDLQLIILFSDFSKDVISTQFTECAKIYEQSGRHVRVCCVCDSSQAVLSPIVLNGNQ